MSSVINMINNGISIISACKYAGISRRSFYYSKVHNNAKKINYKIPVNDIDRIIELCGERPTYGYRRIHALLKRDSIFHNPKTIYRVMKNENLALKQYKHKNRTKQINLTKAIRPDQVWEADITYIHTIKEGTMYLFTIKDVFSREWVGYRLSRSCTRKDALICLEDAIIRSFKDIESIDLTLRTDNGTQFTSNWYRSGVKALKIKQEFIEKNTPEENGSIESFHNSLKTDYIWPYEFEGYMDLEKAIKEAFYDYNHIRPHSSIDYLSPLEFKAKWMNDLDYRKKYEEKINRKVNISVS